MKTILLVDDDPDLRLLLKRGFLSQGLDTVEAGTVHDAESALRQVSIDLVVVDGDLPDQPGIRFVERLRASRADLPIVFLTGVVRDIAIFKRLTSELRVAQVVYKPVDANDFAKQVAQLLKAPASVVPSDEDPFLVAELARLRAKFSAALPGKIELLMNAIAAAPQDLSRAAEARTIAHRLRGSAGSYGFDALGLAVGVVEDLLAPLEVPQAEVPPRLWDDLDRALCGVDLALAQSPGESTSVDEPVALRRALLIVDDDTEFVELARRVSQASAIDIIVSPARQAIQQAGSRRLVGAIINVPVNAQAAFALARQLRESAGNAETPIAFASVDQDLETRLAAIESGATRFLKKPITEERFAETLDQFLSQSRQRRGRVLIVDDDPDVTRHYVRHLTAAGIDVQTLSVADTLLDALDTIRPDVLMLDVRLPRVSGIDVCRVLRRSERWELLPIVMVTGNPSPDIRLKAFRAGASDVIAKPVVPEELLARVGMQLERVRMLRDRSDRDPVSGLLLRRAFLDAAQRALANSRRKGEPLSVVLFSVDAFDRLTSRHGPLAGDDVVAWLGSMLTRRYRVEDLRGRWGESDFILVLPGLREEVAAEAAHKVRQYFADASFNAEDMTSFRATLSAAVATLDRDGATVSDLIRTADTALRAGQKLSPDGVWLPTPA